MAQRVKRLIVNSKHRDSGSSNDFSVYIKPAIEKIKKVKLISASIPNTFYNITDDMTFIFSYVNEGGGSTEIQVPMIPGSYTITSLLDFLNANSDGKFTLSFNSTTLRIEAVNNSSSDTIISGSQFTPNFQEVLGIYLSILVENTGNPIGFSASPFLGGYRYLLLNITPFNVFCKNTQGTAYATFIITEQKNSTDIEFYKPLSDFQQIEYNQMVNNVNELKVQLLTPEGKILDINDSNFSFVLEFEYRDAESDYTMGY